jgi:hypothetical protein
MSRDRTGDSPKSAADLTAELQEDPEYQASMRLREQEQRRNVESYAKAAEPVLRDLEASGFRMSSVGELRWQRSRYDTAIPALLRWLPRISDRHVKEDIIRTLSVPWAKPAAGPALIDEFKKAEDSGIQWAIANGLEVVADDSLFEELVELVQDKRYGKAREMLAVALGNMKDPRAIGVLMGLLDDEDVIGHAVIGLGRLRAPAARQRLEALTSYPKDWVQEEAKKALAALSGS